MKSNICPICHAEIETGVCPYCGFAVVDDFVNLRTVSIPTKADLLAWQLCSMKDREPKQNGGVGNSNKTHNYKGPYRQTEGGSLWQTGNGSTSGEYSFSYKKAEPARAAGEEKAGDGKGSGEYSFSYKKAEPARAAGEEKAGDGKGSGEYSFSYKKAEPARAAGEEKAGDGKGSGEYSFSYKKAEPARTAAGEKRGNDGTSGENNFSYSKAKTKTESRRTGNAGRPNSNGRNYDPDRFAEELDEIKTAFAESQPKEASSEKFAVKDKEKPVFEGPAAQCGETEAAAEEKPAKKKNYALGLIVSEVLMVLVCLVIQSVPLLVLFWAASVFCFCSMIHEIPLPIVLKIVLDIGGLFACTLPVALL